MSGTNEHAPTNVFDIPQKLNMTSDADAMIKMLQDMADHADNPEGFSQNEGDAWRDGIEAAIRTIRLGGWRDRP